MGAKPFATTTEASAARIARENIMVDPTNFFVEHQQECQTEIRRAEQRKDRSDDEETGYLGSV
jgi:hypothetical protein